MDNLWIHLVSTVTAICQLPWTDSMILPTGGFENVRLIGAESRMVVYGLEKGGNGGWVCNNYNIAAV